MTRRALLLALAVALAGCAPDFWCYCDNQGVDSGGRILSADQRSELCHESCVLDAELKLNAFRRRGTGETNDE